MEIIIVLVVVAVLLTIGSIVLEDYQPPEVPDDKPFLKDEVEKWDEHL